jgi:ribose transport system substrate-binding protein
VIVAAAVVLAGSSSAGALGAHAQATSTPTSEVSGDPFAEAQAAVDALIDISNIEMPMPTEPVTPGEHRIAVLPAGLAGQGAKTVAPFVVEAIEAAGWEASDLLDGKFDPVTQSGLIQQAVQDGYDGIILVAITPSSVANAVEVATAAGVPIVCVNCGPDPDRDAAPDVVNSEGDAEAIGLAQGQYALAAMGEPGSIVIFRDETYGQQVVQARVTQEYLAENCPECEVEVIDMTVADATAPGVPLFSGFMSSHPADTVDVVITPYDTASAPFAQAAAEAGRDELQFVGFGSLQVFYEMIAAGTPVGAKATVSVPIPFESWAGVDQMARLLAGQEPWDSTTLPIALVTADNADQFNPETPYLDSGEDFRAAFLELWGLS